jgi:8-oxo-dGTP pyrophosphatase MutT (NUDIX family)
MVRRGDGQSFMPGVWVFPGGVIEPGETAPQSAVRELAEETRIELDPETTLHPWSRWITPEVVPVRFDTHFFVALAPAHAPPRVDGAEVDDAGWFHPQAALDSHREGELKLVFPTIRTLETLVPYADAEQVLAAAPERDLEPILPRVVGTRADHRVLLPGEAGYDDAAADIEGLPS